MPVAIADRVTPSSIVNAAVGSDVRFVRRAGLGGLSDRLPGRYHGGLT